jgi:tetratricopeptide (TPR) repeat protein
MRFSEKDKHHLQAAEGWIELNDLIQANAELNEITPQMRAHPDVLAMRRRIFDEAKRWDKLLVVAESLSKGFPDDVDAWVDYARAFSNLGKTEEAIHLQKLKLQDFEHDRAVPYFLGCFTCKIGKLDEARSWLIKAFSTELGSFYRMTWLQDPDLEPLWVEIQSDDQK